MGSECNLISPNTHYIVLSFLLSDCIKNIMLYKSESYLFMFGLWVKQ